MADITLRDYLAKLDTLLNNGASSEAIHHCRHILQYFPKNVETYRFLGRALVDTQNWPQAGEVLRRVLSVYPEDFFAHVGLSQVSLMDKRPDDAIWHLERAFDQAPNNESVLDALRELYRKHHHVEHAKVHLTAGAVAQQYIRNGLYPQAIHTLQQALAQAPDRMDLKLLLARTYWDGGQKLDAAETAVDILKTLPDCLEPNRILAELWLGESRPSDAQRYISNIQSVDPYLALQLAKGQDVPDDAYKLEELDYRRVAERENVTRAPDWLQAVDQAAESGGAAASADSADWMGTLRSHLTTEQDELPSLTNESLSTSLPQDWFANMPDAPNDTAAPPVPATPRKRTGLTGLLTTLNEPDETPAEAEPQATDFADIADDLPIFDDLPIPAEESSVDDLFPDEDFAPQPTVRDTGTLRGVDPLAWLKESGSEDILASEDEPQPAPNLDLFGADDDSFALQNVEEADPLAWLKDNNDLSAVAEESEASPATIDHEAGEEDPLAWLQRSDVGVIDETPQAPSTARSVNEPIDWLSDESLLDEALNLEALTTSQGEPSQQRASGMMSVPATAEKPDRQDDMADEKNNELDWMNDSGEKSASGDDDLTWASNQLPSDEQDLPDLFPDLNPSAEEQPAADALDWMSELDDGNVQPAGNVDESDIPEWLTQMQPEDEQPAASPEPVAQQPDASSNEGDFEWMTEASDIGDDVGAEAVGDVPDWLNQMQPDESQLSNEPQAATDAPDWLSQMQPDDAEPVVSGQRSMPDESNLEWLSQTDDAGEEIAAEPAADMPDWLSEMQSAEPEAAPEPTMQAESASDAGDLEWMSEGPSDEEAAAEPAADVPDWLSEMQSVPEAAPEPTMQAESAAEASGFDWIDEAASSGEEETAAEPATDVPDWLSEMQSAEPEAVPEPTMQAESAPDAGDLEWMNEVPSGDEAVTAEPAADMPDWLSEMQSAEPEAAPEPTMQAESAPDAGGFDWISQADDVGEEVVAEPAADMPDWLSEMQSAEPEAAPEPTMQAERAVDAGDLEWMNEVPSDDEEVVAEPAADMPDWLSEMQSAEPESAPEPTMQAESAPDAGDLEWIGEVPSSDDEVVAEPAADMPDWLSEMQSAEPESAPEPTMQAESAPDTGDLEWIGEAPSSDEEAAVKPAAEMPNWLSEMQPDEPEAASEPTMQTESAAEVGGFDWGDGANTEAREPSGDVPEWLTTLQDAEKAPETPSAVVPEPVSEIEAVPVGEEGLTPPHGAVPDWLQELHQAATPSDEEVATEHVETARMAENEDGWETENADVEPAIAGEMPDWLSEVKSSRSEPQVPEQEAQPASEFEWIDDVTSTEAQPESEMETVNELSFDDDDDLLSADDMPMDEEAPDGPVPAGNAPDWLNAMVPGLDVDYDAPEDEPIEHEFLPGSENRAIPTFQSASQPARNREFEWLVDIVDEETQQMKAVEGSPPARTFHILAPADLVASTD